MVDARGTILEMSFILLAAGSLFLSAIVFSVFLFIAKCNALEELKKLPGPKPSVFFGNALQLRGEVHGKFIDLHNMHCRKRCNGRNTLSMATVA